MDVIADLGKLVAAARGMDQVAGAVRVSANGDSRLLVAADLIETLRALLVESCSELGEIVASDPSSSVCQSRHEEIDDRSTD